MTAARQPAGVVAGPRPGSNGGSSDGAGGSAPVIVLTYGHAGAARLQALLDEQPELACTASTGLLAACDQVAATWRAVERRPPGTAMTGLARSSVRALAVSVMTVIAARGRGRRWCEISAAEPGAATTFADVFPGTQFVCLHRACPDVVFAVLSANPWGLPSPGFTASAAAYPGNRVAAVAAWWAQYAEAILEFEEAHPQDCLRVRYEDLAGNRARAEREICGFLGLAGPATDLPEPPGWHEPELEGTQAPGCGAGMPAGQLPAPLLARVNSLHARLGYPPLGAGRDDETE